MVELSGATRAHLLALFRPEDAAEAERLLARELPAGVAFVLDDAVDVLAGPRRGAKGAIVSLRGLEPEPRYLVKLDSGEAIEAFQRVLRRRDGS